MSEAKRFINFIEGSGLSMRTIEGGSTKYLYDLIDKGFADGLIEFERPDILFNLKDMVLLLEHFEFNSSKNVKNSSLKNRRLAEIDRKVKNEIKKNPGEPIVISEALNNEPSIKNYVDNLIRNSNKHINKYNDYLNNFKKNHESLKSKTIEFGFIIENTSPIPDTIFYNDKLTLICPFNFKEFIDFLESNEKINHLFYLGQDMKKQFIIYFYNNKENRDLLLNSLNFYNENNELVSKNNHVTTGVVPIDTE